jgi:hypothetical protein
VSEQRFIGIDLASEGGLTEFNDTLYCFDRISPKTVKPRDEAFDYLEHYRGYRYFDKYEPVQVDRLIQLIDYLCDTYSIERQVPYPTIDHYGERLVDFKGVIGHAMVRRDKSDPAPMLSLGDRIISENKLAPISIPKAAQPQAIHSDDGCSAISCCKSTAYAEDSSDGVAGSCQNGIDSKDQVVDLILQVVDLKQHAVDPRPRFVSRKLRFSKIDNSSR